MSPDSSGGTSTADSFARLRRWVEIGERFEEEWVAGHRPTIEATLGHVPEHERSAILGVLIEIELSLRLRGGETPGREEYLARFPDDTIIVAEAFAGVGTGSGTTIDCTPPRPPSAPPSPRHDGPRYRILREIGRGGLGIVSAAFDAELNREVALKEIRGDHADRPGGRARFLLEAEVTGGLDHPSIVPVHSLGAFEDGRPYYVMRLIAANDLAEEIALHRGSDPAGRPLRFRQLLRHFLDACNAVAHAHSRGVLHRDLKPKNIMLGPFGETLVVDWGLAKPLGRQGEPGPDTPDPLVPSNSELSDLTHAGAFVGSPAFMAPEATTPMEPGHRLAPPADVYSLGATLFCLLTGRTAPIRARSIGELLEQVRAGAVPRPRSLDSSIPPPLEAICLKAMSLRPTDRYPSARALGEDIERWLADEPVSAYPEPPLVRASRWARRHRTAVVGSAALMASATIGLAVHSVLIGNEKARSDAHYAVARETVDQILRSATRGLAYVPEADNARRGLTRAALAGYEEFHRLHPDDPDVQFDLAGIHRQLAGLGRMNGEDSSAREGYIRSIALLRRLLDRHPDQPDYRRRLAEARIDLGELHRMQGRKRDAEAEYRAAIDLVDDPALPDRDEPPTRRIAAMALLNLGVAQLETGRFLESRQSTGLAIELLGTSAARTPTLANAVLRIMATTNLGHALRESGEVALAGAALESADRLVRSLNDRDRQIRDVRYLIASLHIERAHLHALHLDQRAQAVSDHQTAMVSLATLARTYRTISLYRLRLAEACNGRGTVLLAAGRVEEAEHDARQARDLLEKLVGGPGDQGEIHRQLGHALDLQARIADARDQPDEARAFRDQAIACVERALETNPDSPGARGLRDELRGHLADPHAADKPPDRDSNASRTVDEG